MVKRKIIYNDVLEYEFLFEMIPSLLLKTMIKTNANVVSKFETKIILLLGGLTHEQEEMLDSILNSSVVELQEVMCEAYDKTGKKQYKLLSEPKATKFIEKNIAELKKVVERRLK